MPSPTDSKHPMTPEQRQAEFNRLFEAIPGRNVDRIKRVCDAILCRPNTVRIWRMARPPRVISARSLQMLRRHLDGAAE